MESRIVDKRFNCGPEVTREGHVKYSGHPLQRGDEKKINNINY